MLMGLPMTTGSRLPLVSAPPSTFRVGKFVGKFSVHFKSVTDARAATDISGQARAEIRIQACKVDLHLPDSAGETWGGWGSNPRPDGL
jgi:hypothetical protein